MESVIQYYSHAPLLEWAAVLTALAYVVLAARNVIWCWPMALISTALYTYLFYDVYLWMDSLLQVYYFGMAIFGWFAWRNYRSTSNASTKFSTRAIVSWHSAKHLKICIVLALMSLCVGWVMANFTPTDFPYVDSFTTVYAVFATYLVTQKVIENWWYWVVIDLVSIYIYIEKQLMPTAFLFVIYVVIAFYGYFSWRQIKHQEHIGITKVTTVAH